MATHRDIGWRYAPLWSILFGAAAALLKQTGTRYALKREFVVKPSDFLIGMVVAAFSYGAFRVRHGQVHDSWYER